MLFRTLAVKSSKTRGTKNGFPAGATANSKGETAAILWHQHRKVFFVLLDPFFLLRSCNETLVFKKSL